MSKLPDLSIVAISPDQPQLEADLPRILSRLLAGGVTAFMFREKRLADEAFVRQARLLRRLCDQANAAFILNERVELAEPVGASIVHLTWKSPTFDRSQFLPGIRIGRSIHSTVEGQKAVQAGLDYVVAGPVFPTPSKVGLVDALGLGGLASMCVTLGLPVVAVGGIKSDAVAKVHQAGAAGVAGISCFFPADHPQRMAEEFAEAWGSSQ